MARPPREATGELDRIAGREALAFELAVHGQRREAVPGVLPEERVEPIYPDVYRPAGGGSGADCKGEQSATVKGLRALKPRVAIALWELSCSAHAFARNICTLTQVGAQPCSSSI